MKGNVYKHRSKELEKNSMTELKDLQEGKLLQEEKEHEELSKRVR